MMKTVPRFDLAYRKRDPLPDELYLQPLQIPYDVVDEDGDVVGHGVFRDCVVTSCDAGYRGETLTSEPVTGLEDRILPFTR